MKEYSLSNLNPIIKEIIVAFMIHEKMCSFDNWYFFKDKLFIFSTGIPYGFCGRLKIINKFEDRDMYLKKLETELYAKFVQDESPFTGLFLDRIIDFLDNKRSINPLKIIIPEAYPPDIFG